MKTTKITHEATIDAPVDVVWQLTTEVERWPELMPTVTSVQLLDTGPIGVGSRARIVQPRLRPAVWTVSVFEPRRRFVWGTRLLGARVDGVHEIEADGPERSRNRLTLELHGMGGAILGRLGGRSLRRTLAIENAAFAQHAADRTAERA